jgi:hypothetical protein
MHGHKIGQKEGGDGADAEDQQQGNEASQPFGRSPHLLLGILCRNQIHQIGNETGYVATKVQNQCDDRRIDIAAGGRCTPAFHVNPCLPVLLILWELIIRLHALCSPSRSVLNTISYQQRELQQHQWEIRF